MKQAGKGALRGRGASRLTDTPGNSRSVYWCLLTMHAVEGLEQALQVLAWYPMRCNIEQVFRLLEQTPLPPLVLACSPCR